MSIVELQSLLNMTMARVGCLSGSIARSGRNSKSNRVGKMWGIIKSCERLLARNDATTQTNNYSMPFESFSIFFLAISLLYTESLTSNKQQVLSTIKLISFDYTTIALLSLEEVSTSSHSLSHHYRVQLDVHFSCFFTAFMSTIGFVYALGGIKCH